MYIISKKIRKETIEQRKKCLKHKYRKGILFRIIGCAQKGYTLQSMCLIRKKWENLYEKKGKGIYSDLALLQLLKFRDELIIEMNKVGIKTEIC